MDSIKTDKKDLEKKLSPELYSVAIDKGTEAPFSGEFLNNKEPGIYTCAVCGRQLFSSKAKFDSGTGWPSFNEPVNRENVELKEDLSFGMRRTEVLCKHCGAHLGHLFDDGKAKSKERYCINSVCLNFSPPETQEKSSKDGRKDSVSR